MKTAGLIGGMSWESTASYYRIMNEEVHNRLGGLNSAKLIMYSVNFAEFDAFMAKGDWDSAASTLIDAAKRLETGGADFVMICTNTMHKVAPEVQAAVCIPLIHIADATAAAIRTAGVKKVGLLGTTFTMEDDFMTGRLKTLHGIEALVPDKPERDELHRIIFSELCQGIVKPDSKTALLSMIKDLEDKGAEGIILGCTELPMLVTQDDIKTQLFDTTRIHAVKAVDVALEPAP